MNGSNLTKRFLLVFLTNILRNSKSGKEGREILYMQKILPTVISFKVYGDWYFPPKFH